MTTPVALHGYRFSVYHRIARLVLEEKGVAYATRDVDPFDPDLPDDWRRMHPFGRVPVLTHEHFTLYETAAIARYVDAAFDGPALTPTAPKAVGRMAQAIAILDAYGYRPLVRQVFAHAVFRPAMGTSADPAEIAAGLAAAHPVLAALDDIAAEGHVLAGPPLTLADCHLAPMLAAFAAAPEGADHLARHPALSARWAHLADRPSFTRTDPGLPD
ncbi:MAG: glutathione S-transferase family protein [Pseudomonadota bacterium]